jgi:hypothetical protein
MIGWVKIHRQLLDSEIFANTMALKIWIWILLKASTKQRFISLNVGNGFSEIKLEAGQLLFGRFKAEEKLNIDGSTIYKWLKKMELLEMISIISNNKYSIITVCNYEYYQEISNKQVTTSEQQDNNNVTTSEQQDNNNVTQLKNNKELKELKELKENNENSEKQKFISDNYLLNGVPVEIWDYLKLEEKKEYSTMIWNELLNSSTWVNDYCRQKKFTPEDFKNQLKEFIIDCNSDESICKGLKEMKKHFQNKYQYLMKVK